MFQTPNWSLLTKLDERIEFFRKINLHLNIKDLKFNLNILRQMNKEIYQQKEAGEQNCLKFSEELIQEVEKNAILQD